MPENWEPIWDEEKKIIDEKIAAYKELPIPTHVKKFTSNLQVRIHGTSMYDVYKEMLKDDYAHMPVEVPKEDTAECKRLIIAEANEFKEREHDQKAYNEAVESGDKQKQIELLNKMLKKQMKKYKATPREIKKMNKTELVNLTLNYNVQEIEKQITAEAKKRVEDRREADE